MRETESPMAGEAHTAAETSARMTHTSWRLAFAFRLRRSRHTLLQPRLFMYNPFMARAFRRLLVAPVLFAATACGGDPSRSPSAPQQAESSAQTATHSGSP